MYSVAYQGFKVIFGLSAYQMQRKTMFLSQFLLYIHKILNKQRLQLRGVNGNKVKVIPVVFLLF